MRIAFTNPLQCKVGLACVDWLASYNLKLLSAAIAFTSIVSVSPANGENSFVPPMILNPQSYTDCRDLDKKWNDIYMQAQANNSACEASEGPKVKFKDPPYMSNCRRYQQAWWTCAGQQDALCKISNERNAAAKACGESVQRARAANGANDRKEKLTEQAIGTFKEMKNSNDEMKKFIKDPIDYGIQRYAETPESGAKKLTSMAKEVARKTGASGADSQPALNFVGDVSDKFRKSVPGNPVFTEIGTQSAGAARAKMGSALQELDRLSFPNQNSSGNNEIDLAAKVQASKLLINLRQEEEEQLRAQAEYKMQERAAQLREEQQVRRNSEILQGILGAVNNGLGGARNTSTRTDSDSQETKKSERKCWSAETVCGGHESECIARKQRERATLPQCGRGE